MENKNQTHDLTSADIENLLIKHPDLFDMDDKAVHQAFADIDERKETDMLHYAYRDGYK